MLSPESAHGQKWHARRCSQPSAWGVVGAVTYPATVCFLGSDPQDQKVGSLGAMTISSCLWVITTEQCPPVLAEQGSEVEETI